MTIRSLVLEAGLTPAAEAGAAAVFDAMESLHLVERREGQWFGTDRLADNVVELAAVFAGISHYQQFVERDDTTVRVVLTRPDQSLRLLRELTETGWRADSSDETDRAFRDVVQRAAKRLIVMTPFLDGQGAKWARDLLGDAHPSVEIVLILRSLEDPSKWDFPKGLADLRPWITERNVKVYNYSLPRAGGAGRETFHAKVILGDSDFAYVGSANMTAASLETSMEMGVLLDGKGAREISHVVEAVLKCASRWIPEEGSSSWRLR